MSSLTGRTLLQRYKVQAPILEAGAPAWGAPTWELPTWGAQTGGSPVEVYRVWDSECSGFLALCMLREDLAKKEQIVQRFKQEAQALIHLDHPNIVRVYGVEEDGEQVFYLTELVEVASLETEIAGLGGRIFSVARVLEIVRPLCSALQYAHERGVVHGNIQPASVLTSPNDWVLLTQFCSAVVEERAAFASNDAYSFGGNPSYLSPEQIQGLPPAPQSDIYSLGILLFQLLTGQLPFTGSTAGASGSLEERIAWEQVNTPAPSPKTFNPHMSPALVSAIMRCLEKEPARRFGSVADLLNVLEQSMGSSPIVRAPGQFAAAVESLKAGKSKAAGVRQARPRLLDRIRREPGESAVASPPFARRSPVLLFGVVGLLFVMVAAGALLARERALSAVQPSATPTATLPALLSATLPPTPTVARSLIAGLVVNLQGEAFFQFGSKGAVALQPGLPISGSEAGRIWTGAGSLKLILVDGSPLYLGENSTLALAMPDGSSDSRAVFTPGLERGAALVAAQSARVKLQILSRSLYWVEADAGAVAGVRVDPQSGGFQVDCLQGMCRVSKQGEAGLSLMAGERGSFIEGKQVKLGKADYESWRLIGNDVVPTPPTLGTPTPTDTVILQATPTATSTAVPPTPMQREQPGSKPRPREEEPATLAPPA